MPEAINRLLGIMDKCPDGTRYRNLEEVLSIGIVHHGNKGGIKVSNPAYVVTIYLVTV